MIGDAAEALALAVALLGERATRQPEPGAATPPRGQRVDFASQNGEACDKTTTYTGAHNDTTK